MIFSANTHWHIALELICKLYQIHRIWPKFTTSTPHYSLTLVILPSQLCSCSRFILFHFFHGFCNWIGDYSEWNCCLNIKCTSIPFYYSYSYTIVEYLSSLTLSVETRRGKISPTFGPFRPASKYLQVIKFKLSMEIVFPSLFRVSVAYWLILWSSSLSVSDTSIHRKTIKKIMFHQRRVFIVFADWR